jgi:8-oxo-dGTP diphosphatase
MAYDDKYRLGVHAVITNPEGHVLLLKATYGNYDWVLPGGGVDPGETIHHALHRECQEELGVDVTVLYLSGMYFHPRYDAHACVFRCEMLPPATIQLSTEHSEYRYFPVTELSLMQQQRIGDCLQFDGQVKSAVF